MTPKIKRFIFQAAAAFGISLNMIKKTDYRTLSRYILRINASNDLKQQLTELSKCLKEILNYELFAFAIEHDAHLEIWVDPSIYKKEVETIVRDDFAFHGKVEVYPLGLDAPSEKPLSTLNPELLSAYPLEAKHYRAKLYLLPQRIVFEYHQDIIQMIIRTLDIAINNTISINRLKAEVAIDPLTKCYSRRGLNQLIEHSISSCRRHDRPLSAIMIDIDHFKKVNDTYGHLAGDDVLQSISKTLLSQIRNEDYLFRFGGEEFLLILPETKATAAIDIAERLRKQVAATAIRVAAGQWVNITASFGVSSLKRDWDKEKLLKSADDMMYKAKRYGRNMVMPSLQLHRTKGVAG